MKAVVGCETSRRFIDSSTLGAVYEREPDGHGGGVRGLLPLPGLGGAGGGAAGTVHCTLYCTVQVGLLAGPVFLAADKLLLRLGIDDPVSAIPVNGGGGGG